MNHYSGIERKKIFFPSKVGQIVNTLVLTRRRVRFLGLTINYQD
jgi:hypothetical protein